MPAFCNLAIALALLFPALATAQESGNITYGSAFLEPVLPGSAGRENMVKLRYRCHVARNECREHAMWKIIFVFIFLQGDQGPGGYELQANAYSNRFIYPHASRRSAGGEVAGLQNLAGETGLFLSIPDNMKNRRVGAITRSPAMFPTLDQEIDGFRDLWKREQISQVNLTGKTIAVTVARGELVTDLAGWNVHGALPPEDYRAWSITAQWDDQTHRVDFALPAAHSKSIAATRPMQIATEAFVINPGKLQMFFWDLETQTSGSTEWHALKKWKLVQTDAPPTAPAWGFKAGTFANRPAIEVSNDGSTACLSKGETLEMK